ncbi:MAG: GNAT family N-acetyltransferase [Lachnospiraceae bacterium]|nr:GNAT family N-acetyltransferase [Lachnospiraceae bacterium]
MIVETERLLLKSPHEVTAGAVADYYNRNRDFLQQFGPIRSEEFYTTEYQEKMCCDQENAWEKQTDYRFFICRKENESEVIGTIALTNLVRGVFQSCFLGYQLDAEHVNRGYMTEATRRIVEFAFDELRLHRIEGNIIPRNHASRAVVEKCGFVNEGTSRKYLKINGVWEDHIHYVLLNEAME